ncbi:MAG: hypothetical protein HDS35_01080 [Bacteroides sp.]|nr:hypothetical protein [Bacteroides sp.]
MAKKKKAPTLEGIMKMVEADNRCAKAALVLSILEGLILVGCAIFKIFRPV